MTKKTWQFDFVIDSLSKDTAKFILEVVSEIATLANSKLSGGFYEYEEGDDGEESGTMPEGEYHEH